MDKLFMKTIEESKMKIFSLFKFQNKQRTVMVVEDDEMLKPFLIRILYSVDPQMTIKWVKTVEEAKEELKKNLGCNLIISDCLLSNGETGVELMKYCKDLTSQTPFIMISGLKLETINKYIGEIGDFQSFLQKPFREDECRKIVLDLIA